MKGPAICLHRIPHESPGPKGVIGITKHHQSLRPSASPFLASNDVSAHAPSGVGAFWPACLKLHPTRERTRHDEPHEEHQT